MREIRAVFGLDDSTLTLDNAREFFDLTPGSPVKLEQSIFPRIDTPFEASTPAHPVNSVAPSAPATNGTEGLLDISDFQKRTCVLPE